MSSNAVPVVHERRNEAVVALQVDQDCSPSVGADGADMLSKKYGKKNHHPKVIDVLGGRSEQKRPHCPRLPVFVLSRICHEHAFCGTRLHTTWVCRLFMFRPSQQLSVKLDFIS